MFISSILLHVTNTQRLQSAFSVCLAKFGFNHYSMFAPDLMHEFELGVWKALFTHILRLLVALGNDSLQEFDSRYFLTLSNHYGLNNPINYFRFRFRKVPTFGCDTIRRFCLNVSSQTRIAARDYEDMLQVRSFILHFYRINSDFYASVSFLSLMVSSPNTKIKSSRIFSSH